MQRLIIALISCLLLASCEKTLTIDVPEQPHRLVIHCVATPDDSLRLTLRHTAGILQYNQWQTTDVTDGLVVLYDNDVVADTFIYNSATEYYLSDMQLKPGHRYKLLASAAGFETAEATAIAPAEIPADITVTWGARLDGQGNPMAEVRVRFTDPDAATSDCYQVEIKREQGWPYYSGIHIPGCIAVTDPSLEQLRDDDFLETPCYNGGNMYLRDALFNGKEKTLRMHIRHDDILPGLTPVGDTLFSSIRLLHFEDAFFVYQKTYGFMQNNVGNPFAEPVNVPTNVKNGYGYFAILSGVRQLIR